MLHKRIGLEVSDEEYRVSGAMTMIDVYGTRWSNSFDCKVKKSGDSWSAGMFSYAFTEWREIENRLID